MRRPGGGIAIPDQSSVLELGVVMGKYSVYLVGGVGVLVAVQLVLVWLREGSGVVGLLSIAGAVLVVAFLLIAARGWRLTRVAETVAAQGASLAFVTAATPQLRAGLLGLPLVDESGLGATVAGMPHGLVLAARPGFVELWSGPARNPRLYLRLPGKDVRITASATGTVVHYDLGDGAVGVLEFALHGGWLNLRPASAAQSHSRSERLSDLVALPAGSGLVARNGSAWRRARRLVQALPDLDDTEKDVLSDALAAPRSFEPGAEWSRHVQQHLRDRTGADIDSVTIANLLTQLGQS